MLESQPNKRSSGLSRTTPVPNWVLDEAMPFLSDTQLRVLLVVARSTLGWREGKGRKERDWISHRQLQARTGRSSAVVSRAVDALVKRGLLAVMNAAGELLISASARSRVHGRLYFRLMSPNYRGNLSSRESTYTIREEGVTPDSFGRDFWLSTASESEVIDGCHKLLDAGPASTGPASKSKELTAEPASETMPRKPRTTKETNTKEIRESGGRVIRLPVPTLENEVCGVALEDWELLEAGEDETEAITSSAAPTEIDGAVSETIDCDADEPLEGKGIGLSTAGSGFLKFFHRAHRLAKPAERCPVFGLEAHELLERRLAQYSVEELEAWLPRFFECTFGYIRRRHWSLESYLESFQLLQAADQRRRQMEPEAELPG